MVPIPPPHTQLAVIALLNPNRPNIMHKNTIEYQRRVYIYLLKRYLLIKYRSECEVMSRSWKLSRMLSNANQLSESVATDICRQNLDDRDPLFRELFLFTTIIGTGIGIMIVIIVIFRIVFIGFSHQITRKKTAIIRIYVFICPQIKAFKFW
ncbi:unnamed protein product [Oppiella nova]|uniref:Uncharacterized protein n=1 Tax=Oppiella nova TaxID=334625 RepID=A0A7R9M2K0_9ACAR|nr:unnamed protein product [Oppiella nova]CAG2168718.1 unnamed protein product [Oppiella nova]